MKPIILFPPEDFPALSRREFLKAAALAGGALTLSGCGTGNPPAFADSTDAAALASTVPAATSSPQPPAYLPAFESDALISLPVPRKQGGMPLMQALALRSSHRTYGDEEIELHLLSDLLWAAFGINRPAQGLRTAPSAINNQDIELYIAAEKGVYRYDATPHALLAVMPDDLRTLTGTQSFVARSPAVLVYVSDYRKLGGLSGIGSGDSNVVWSWIHTGFISQNVYLFCASEGLSTVVRAMVDRDALEDKIGLDGTKHVTLVQSVGYPDTSGTPD